MFSKIGLEIGQLLLERKPLIERTKLIEYYNDVLKTNQIEIDNLLATMKNWNLTRNVDKILWDNINNSFNFEHNRKKETIETVSQLKEIQSNETLGIFKKNVRLSTLKYFILLLN